MVNLLPVKTDCLKVFKDIGSDKKNLKKNKRKTRIISLASIIDNRYKIYDAHFKKNTLDKIPLVVYTKRQKDDMLHCYTSETKSLNKLIKAIKENQHLYLQGICQFCGINTDSTTDHYLPKGSFPDYCVNALNLFPCCPDCNSLKGDYMWDNLHNTRGIINFYTDTIPQEQFLFANVRYASSVPIIKFAIKRNSKIPPAFYSIVERHFERLNLLNRYKEKFNSIHQQTFRSFQNKRLFKKRPDLVKEFLMDDANQLFLDYGKNFYKGIIKQALANSKTFTSQF